MAALQKVRLGYKKLFALLGFLTAYYFSSLNIFLFGAKI
jgi:hypothetical protein